jgi:hypothetical protein
VGRRTALAVVSRDKQYSFRVWLDRWTGHAWKVAGASSMSIAGVFVLLLGFVSRLHSFID